MHIKEQFPMAHWLNQPSEYWYEFQAAVLDLWRASRLELAFDQNMHSLKTQQIQFPNGTPTFIKDLGVGALIC